MAEEPRLYVKNWKAFQHYSGRRPPWIKLHRQLLDDPQYHRLPLASKALAPYLWLLASESEDGAISALLADLAFRTRHDSDLVSTAVNGLIQHGFLLGELIIASDTLAMRKQNGVTEKETTNGSERETDTETTSAPLALHNNGNRDSSAAATARLYLEAYNVASGRRIQKLTPLVLKGVDRRLREKAGFKAWQLIALPFLIAAQHPDRITNAPDVFLRDGSTTKSGYDWTSRAWDDAAGTRMGPELTAKLVAFSTHHELDLVAQLTEWQVTITKPEAPVAQPA